MSKKKDAESTTIPESTRKVKKIRMPKDAIFMVRRGSDGYELLVNTEMSDEDFVALLSILNDYLSDNALPALPQGNYRLPC